MLELVIPTLSKFDMTVKTTSIGATSELQVVNKHKAVCLKIVLEGKSVFSLWGCEFLCSSFFISGPLTEEVKEERQCLWWTKK